MADKSAKIFERLSDVHERIGDYLFGPYERLNDRQSLYRAAAIEGLLTRTKAASGDEFDQLGQQWTAAGRQRAMSPGADKAGVLKTMQGHLAQLAPPTVATGSSKLTDSGDQSKPATKTPKSDPFVDAIKGGIDAWDRR